MINPSLFVTYPRKKKKKKTKPFNSQTRLEWIRGLSAIPLLGALQ